MLMEMDNVQDSDVVEGKHYAADQAIGLEEDMHQVVLLDLEEGIDPVEVVQVVDIGLFHPVPDLVGVNVAAVRSSLLVPSPLVVGIVSLEVPSAPCCNVQCMLCRSKSVVTRGQDATEARESRAR